MQFNQIFRDNFLLVLLLLLLISIGWNSDVAAGQLHVFWTDNSTNEDGFKSERKIGVMGTYAQTTTVGANVTSYIDSSLVDGATYCYKVRAYNSAGNSAYTPEVCRTVTATVQTFTLTVAKPGTGSGTVTATGIACGADCSEVLPTGNVQLIAAPSASSIFSGWTGGGCSGTALTCTVNLTANTNVNANFVPKLVQSFTLTVTKPGTGSGTVTATGITCGADCSEVLPTGNVQLTAAPSASSLFSGWTGDGCSGTALTCTVNLTANTTVNANFLPRLVQTFTLTVAKAGTGSGAVTATGITCGADCSEVLPTGNVQLTVAPSASSIFSGWSGGGCSGTALTCTVNLTANTMVNATFQPQNNQLATRIGIFRPSTGEWFLDFNGDGKWDDEADAHITSFPHATGDYPVVWNSDGNSGIGTFNSASGTWKLDTDGDGEWDDQKDTLVNSYGKAGDWPVIRQLADIGSIIGTFTPRAVTKTNGRQSVKRGLWNFDVNGNSTMDACSVDECDTFRSGFDDYSAERPITGDWNNTGTENIGLFINGYWYLDVNGNEKWDGSSGGDRLLSFGQSRDLPVVGDWNGTGKTKIGVFRPSTGEWFLDVNGNGKWDGCQLDICIGIWTIYEQGQLPVVGKW